MRSSDIRKQFIEFFEANGHTFVPSSPVVPHDDPTLLFANAGMNPFKPIFLGERAPKYPRVVNSQKCIRAGGKHNDLDDVGRSRRHQTFFEMLGNWSFGDYFKREAIGFSWQLLTEVWKMDPSRLHVTCYEGDEKNGIPRDDEAVRIWKEVAGLSDDHIHFCGKDNFWEMGETGPCGPCTEIFMDRTPDGTGGPSVVTGDDPRVMEFWNNVFIQYYRAPDKSLSPLPARHVDTGMGLERITQILQGKTDNYATDLFTPYFEALRDMSGIAYSGRFPPTNAPDPEAEAADPQLRHDIALRVIADHIRCLTFALTDGAEPSNLGRGYVLRRILRRAVRFGRQTLELKDPFLYRLVPVVVDAMGDAFPELKSNPRHVAEIIKEEEVGFGRTLDRGIQLFEEAAEKAAGTAAGGGRPKRVISAADAFKLHDTYGFPIDLTRIMAEERGYAVDVEGYDRLMDEAREKARAGGEEADRRLFELPPDVLADLQRRGVAATDDSPKYGSESVRATVKAIWDGTALIDRTHGAEAADRGVAVILDRTCFYAEMGGQVGDSGEVRSGNGVLSVTATRAAGGYVLHVGQMLDGHLSVGDRVEVGPPAARRQTEQNHTATHLTNWALREVLGDGVQQKGSLVDREKLRFDFSHAKAMTDEEIGRVEALVGQCVTRKMPVYAEVAPLEQARAIQGLRAVFGEKYPPAVRVVSVGAPVTDLLKDPGNEKWRQYSIEFCGGTHVGNSADVGEFVIVAEEAVGKGLRRVVALSGKAASEARQSAAELAATVARARSAPKESLPEAAAEIRKALAAPRPVPLRDRRAAQAAEAEAKAAHKAWEREHRKQAASTGGGDASAVAARLLGSAADAAGGKLIVADVPGAAPDQLRGIIDAVRRAAKSYAALLASADDNRVSFAAGVSDDLIAKGLSAGDWVRETAKAAGGSGGGRPQFAQAGGKDPVQAGVALERAKDYALTTLQAAAAK